MSANDSTVKQTFVRQFSIRGLFVVVSIAAVLMLCLRFAVAGQYWAIGVVAAAVALFVLFIAHAVLFIVASQVSRLWSATKSPFQPPAHSIAAEVQPSEQETSP